jgi:hypothetical protein
MPINLDSCITGIFVPGNIGASSGQPPVVRVVPPRLPATFTVQVNEVASAIAVVSVFGDVGAVVTETAHAVDAVYFAQVHEVLVGELVSATDAPSVLEPVVYDVDVAEATAAADALDWVPDTEAGFYGVLGITGPIPPASSPPIIIYIEV